MFNLDSLEKAVTAELDEKFVELIESALVRLGSEGLGSLPANGNYRWGVAPRPDQRRATYIHALSIAAKLSYAELGKNYADKITRAYETTSPHYDKIVVRYEIYRTEKYAATLKSHMETLKSRGSVIPPESELEDAILTKFWSQACTSTPTSTI